MYVYTEIHIFVYRLYTYVYGAVFGDRYARHGIGMASTRRGKGERIFLRTTHYTARTHARTHVRAHKGILRDERACVSHWSRPAESICVYVYATRFARRLCTAAAAAGGARLLQHGGADRLLNMERCDRLIV